MNQTRGCADALETGEGSRIEIWFSLLGGAIAWLIHLLLAYLISEWGCVRRVLPGFTLLGLSGLTWLLLGMSLVTLLLAGAATTIAYRGERRMRTGEDTHEARMGIGDAGVRISRTALFLSGTFFFIILVESVPIFFWLQGC